MSPETSDRDRLEQALRHGLAARAAAVRVEPDRADLARRVAQAGRRPPEKAKLLGAAAAVMAASLAGGAFGSLVAAVPARHAVLSSQGAGDGGPLPTGPTGRGRSQEAAVAGPGASGILPFGVLQEAASGLGAPAASVRRTTASRVRLEASGGWLNPLVIAGGAGARGCYAAELVSSTARRAGVSGRSTGVILAQPLAASGLEVVDSGAEALSAGSDIWWATVAVGTGVARVAAEPPDGTTDLTRPIGGIALVGGIVPSAEVGRYFSVVSETAAGQSLHAIGFLAGGAPRAVGTAPVRSGLPSLLRGCPSSRTWGSSTPVSDVPSTELLAAASVLTALQQDSALGGHVVVDEVRFLGAGSAEVAYRVGAGRLRTGTATLDGSGTWRLSSATGS